MFFLFLIIFLINFNNGNTLDFKYHTQDELEKLLYEFNGNLTEPLKGNVYSIGKTNKERDILVFELTAASINDSVPNIRLTGNIHGNEPPGREILLHFIEHLIENYKNDELVQWLLNNTKIHFAPSLNPDGWFDAEPGDCIGVIGRNNAKNIDLNRNFPDFIDGNKQPIEEIETIALKNWMEKISFVLGGDLHAGAIVTIYPFHRLTKTKYGYEVRSSITPDDNIFQHLANVYARNNDVMYHQSIYCDNETFPGGITRGAAWYYFLGGMQDYSYILHGTMALTFEISCCKYPPEESLSAIWEQNKKSLLLFCLEANRGVKAIIKDSKMNKPIKNANITILGIDKIFHTNENGEFWKILLPGKYYLRVEADKYKTVEYIFVVENLDNFPKMTSLEIEMTKT